MSAFVLNPRISHRKSLLDMVNHYNQATIGTPLTLSNTLFSTLTDVDTATGATKVTLTNNSYSNDAVEVDFFRLPLADFMDMDKDQGDFDWYAPDDWDADTSPALAVAACKAAAVRQKIDLDLSSDTVTASRYFDGELNRFVLVITTNSMVWQEEAKFVMPRHFSEEITVTDLNGLIFTPIASGSVID